MRIRVRAAVLLGTAAIANGFAFWATQGVAFVGRWPAEFTVLARGTVLGIPAPSCMTVSTG